MNFTEAAAFIVTEINKNTKISKFFQKSYIAERVNNFLVARSPIDFKKQPIKLLQSDNIGNYFYVVYDNTNIAVSRGGGYAACSKNYYCDIPCQLIFVCRNGRLDTLLSVFLHELEKFEAVEIQHINTNVEAVLFDELENLPKIPTDLIVAEIDFNLTVEIPTYTNELCLDLFEFCDNC